MKKLILYILLSLSFVLQAQERYPIIPKPVYMEEKEGVFIINKKTLIQTSSLTNESGYVIRALQNSIKEVTNYTLKEKTSAVKKNTITFISDQAVTQKEGYKLSVSKDKVEIRFTDWQGAFYAVQTLRQLFLVDTAIVPEIYLPHVEISDYPLLPYRSYLLDVARYYFPVSHLKRTIDLLAFYKINVFHLHLTDDQGWRFESKKYPKLQEISAWRNETQSSFHKDLPLTFDGIKHGGYYTQKELKELVQYAKERFIRIVPEIDIPGHSQAVLAAFPQYGCVEDTSYTVSSVWGIHDNILCPKEETFKFLEDIFDEVMEVFPNEYIHIGGDEVPKDRWKESEFCQNLIKKYNLKNEDGLQSYFIKRMEKYLNSKERTIIGWDEILDGGLVPNAIVMSWRGEEGGIKAAISGHDVIMTPHRYMYLNYYNTPLKDKVEPIGLANVITLDKIYNYCPFPDSLTIEEKKHIIGLQACLWTEYCKTTEHAESLTYPRLCAMAETAWTPVEHKNYEDFYYRLTTNIKLLDRWKVNYSKLFLEYK